MPYAIIPLQTMYITTSGEYVLGSSSSATWSSAAYNRVDDAERVTLYVQTWASSSDKYILVDPASPDGPNGGSTNWVPLSYADQTSSGTYLPIDLSTQVSVHASSGTFMIVIDRPAFGRIMLTTGPTTTTQTKVLGTKKILV